MVGSVLDVAHAASGGSPGVPVLDWEVSSGCSGVGEITGVIGSTIGYVCSVMACVSCDSEASVTGCLIPEWSGVMYFDARCVSVVEVTVCVGALEVVWYYVGLCTSVPSL